MQFTRDPVQGLTIRHIEPGRIRIGDRQFERCVGLTADEVLQDWQTGGVAALLISDLDPLLQLEPDVMIIGTGWRQVLPPRELVFAMARRGIGLEVMDTPAACRTFNILVAEDRRPAALLFLD